MRTQFFLKSLAVVLSLAVIPVILSVKQDTTPHRLTAAVIQDPPTVTPTTVDAATRMRVSEAYGTLPLHFEANRGQTDSHVRFLSRGAGSTFFLTPTEAVLTLRGRRDVNRYSLNVNRREQAKGEGRNLFPLPSEGEGQGEGSHRTSVLRMKLVGANRSPQVVGREELPGKANYFIGNDPTKWRTNIPTYKKVAYPDIYPGIDLMYYGNQRQLEYDLVVNPGADPNQMVLGFEGVDRLEVDAQGDLVLHTAVGALRQRRPVIYQEVEGVRRELSGGYVLRGPQAVGFRVAAYDQSTPLVIDPTLVYSTYLGGSEFDEGFGIAVDAAGAAYVTGRTSSADFTAGCTVPCTVLDNSLDGGGDAFVTKLDPTGTALVYSTYLGGSSVDIGRGIVVDAAGAASVTGATQSADFPTACTAPCTVLDNTLGGLFDAFVTKLDPTGTALVYSTYLGGSSDDIGVSIAANAAGAASVTGFTFSTDFTAGCTAPCTVLDNTLGGSEDAFVTKLNAAGTALLYSTYLGGSDFDRGFGIAVDAEGAAFVTGVTRSADFTAGCTAPCTKLDGSLGGGQDAFVTKLNATGTALLYSTYLGGSGLDQGHGIAVDAVGAAYVTGQTTSTDFTANCTAPCTVLDATLDGLFDAFVVKIAEGAEGCPPNDDEDNDGLLDANERLLGTFLANLDSDGDGIRDGNDDANGNGKDDEDEDDNDECPDTDSDGDGIDDEDEDD